MSSEEFQDGHPGSHLGYQNRTILAILNLCCHCDASHQVSAQSDLGFGRRMSFEEFHMAILDIGTILAILNLHVATMPPIKFQLNPTHGSGGDVENVKS